MVRLGQSIADIVSRNQNPGCGGDRQMSAAEWTALRDFAEAVAKLRSAGRALAKAEQSPMLCDLDPGSDSDIPF